jgi:hypothetical protein
LNGRHGLGLKSTLKRLARAVPVILANAPAIAEMVREVTRALREPKVEAEPAAPPLAAPEPVPVAAAAE